MNIRLEISTTAPIGGGVTTTARHAITAYRQIEKVLDVFNIGDIEMSEIFTSVNTDEGELTIYFKREYARQ